jgi:hypothetical protein
MEVAPLNPEGMKQAGKWSIFLREVAYLPDSDLFLWVDRMNIDGKISPDLYPAFDAAKNQWVTVKLTLPPGVRQFGNVSTGVAWDAKRSLLWVGDSGYDGGVYALRFDPAKAEITPLKDYVPPAEQKK